MGTWVWCPKLPLTIHPALHGWARGEAHQDFMSCLGTEHSNIKALPYFCGLFCFVFIFLLFFNFQTVIILCELAIPWAYFGVSLVNLGLLEPRLEFFPLNSEKMEDFS